MGMQAGMSGLLVMFALGFDGRKASLGRKSLALKLLNSGHIRKIKGLKEELEGGRRGRKSQLSGGGSWTEQICADDVSEPCKQPEWITVLVRRVDLSHWRDWEAY